MYKYNSIKSYNFLYYYIILFENMHGKSTDLSFIIFIRLFHINYSKKKTSSNIHHSREITKMESVPIKKYRLTAEMGRGHTKRLSWFASNNS